MDGNEAAEMDARKGSRMASKMVAGRACEWGMTKVDWREASLETRMAMAKAV